MNMTTKKIPVLQVLATLWSCQNAATVDTIANLAMELTEGYSTEELRQIHECAAVRKQVLDGY